MSNEKEVKEIESDNKKFWIISIISLAIVGVLSFGIAYIIRSNQIDKEFEEAFQTQNNEVEMPAIQGYVIHYNDKNYANVVELIGLIKEPVTLTMTVIYPDSEVEKQAYISFNNNPAITYAQIVDGDYVQIILPSLEADIPSYEEFLQDVEEAQKNKENNN